MSVRSVPIGEVCSVVGGGTPARNVPEYYDGSIPWVTPKDMKTWEIRNAQVNISEAGLENSATRLIASNSVLVVVRSGVLKHTVPVAINRVPVAINQDMKALLCSESADPDYVARFVKACSPVILQWVRATTADNFPIDKLKRLEIPLPPLPEQRRIAEILDKADALRAKRRAALGQLDALAQSIFLDMFGDPATNPKGWQRQQLGEITVKFSDGPFGSNLKSSHYVEKGVRVVRLQNIGVGEFIDDDAAYIAESHFAKLRKHECLPGDVLVGTLGDPNLRACIQPLSLPVALNKADCVQIRPDPTQATAEFICALLNQPATELMAQDLMRGQTRVRVSMGRLRALSVPVPAIEAQRDFSRRIAALHAIRFSQLQSTTEVDTLFATLQHRVFASPLFT